MTYPPYVGTASYYACARGSGACATCNSNSTNQVASPNLNNHNPNYAASCGPIPVHSCGDVLSVANYCNCDDPIGAYLTVVDHGPGAACDVDTPKCDLCVCSGGTAYYRYMDLPQGTYQRLGGNLTQGLIIIGWNGQALQPERQHHRTANMHSDISRRSLLRASALAVGALRVMRGTEGLRAQDRPPYEVANCDVAAVSNGQIYCEDTDGNPVTLPIDRTTSMWKGKENAGLEAIKAGDHIDATIEITSTGERHVKKMWVNIANVTGTVSRLTPDGFDLLIRHGVGATGQVLRVLVGDNVDVNNGLVTKAAIAPGLSAQVIGQGLPGGKAGVTQVLAVTILLHDKRGVMPGAEHLPTKRGTSQ